MHKLPITTCGAFRAEELSEGLTVSLVILKNRQ